MSSVHRSPSIIGMIQYFFKGIIQPACFLFSILTLVSFNTFASTLDADLNDDAFKIRFNLSDKNADLGILASALFTDDNGEMYSFGLRTQAPIRGGDDSIRGGFGLRAYHISPDPGDSFQSLALGGYIKADIPSVEDLTFGGELYYGPDITTTDDVDSLLEFSARLAYRLFENASLYIGYRGLEIEVNDQDFDFEESAHVGFSLEF